jgi:phosphotransferase system  glucose/maltose/N-acetylglucosamine-specific IIC component
MILFLLLVAYSVTFGMQNKALFLCGKIKLLDDMLNCTYCAGFHGGWITFIALNPVDLSSYALFFQSTIAFALASAAFSYLLDTLARVMEAHAEPIQIQEEYHDDEIESQESQEQ